MIVERQREKEKDTHSTDKKERGEEEGGGKKNRYFHLLLLNLIRHHFTHIFGEDFEGPTCLSGYGNMIFFARNIFFTLRGKKSLLGHDQRIILPIRSASLPIFLGGETVDAIFVIVAQCFAEMNVPQPRSFAHEGGGESLKKFFFFLLLSTNIHSHS